MRERTALFALFRSPGLQPRRELVIARVEIAWALRHRKLQLCRAGARHFSMVLRDSPLRRAISRIGCLPRSAIRRMTFKVLCRSLLDAPSLAALEIGPNGPIPNYVPNRITPRRKSTRRCCEARTKWPKAHMRSREPEVYLSDETRQAWLRSAQGSRTS